MSNSPDAHAAETSRDGGTKSGADNDLSRATSFESASSFQRAYSSDEDSFFRGPHHTPSNSAPRSRASSNLTRDFSDFDETEHDDDDDDDDSDYGGSVGDDDSDDDDDDSDDDYAGFDGDEDGDGSAPAKKLHPASKQTVKDFRRSFSTKDVPETDQLFKAYTCAWSKEILYQGRMFVTDNHVCFYARIFGMTQKLVLPFSKITKIEPKTLMSIIPNSIAIRTSDDKRYTFTSFANRNRTMGVLRKLRNSGGIISGTGGAHASGSAPTTPGSGTDGGDPGQRTRGDSGKGNCTPLSSVRSLGGGGKTRSASQQGVLQQAAASVNKSFEDVINIFPSANPNTPTTMASKSAVPKAPGANAGSGSPAPTNGSASAGGSKWPVENLGPEEHARTSLPEPAEHEKVLATSTIRAPPGVVANILFGKDTAWYKHFIVEVEHNRDLDKFVPFPNLQVGSERSFEYIKPLNGPVGPKQTKCLSTEKIEKWDLSNYIEVITTTATPDVPSGSSFTTLTRTILTWGDNNSTQIRLGTWLEWTAKTWLKGPIEKGAIDGQTSFCKSLVAELSKKIDSGARGGKAAEPGQIKPVDVESQPSEPKEKTVRKSSTAKQASQAIREWQQLCIGLTVAVVVLLFFVFVFWRRARHHGRGPSAEDQRSLLRLQQELELWQWIEDRKDTRIAHRRTLSEINIEKAMAVAEKKLASLKASLG